MPRLRSISSLGPALWMSAKPPVALFLMFLFLVEIFLGLYTHIRDWMLFTMTGA